MKSYAYIDGGKVVEIIIPGFYQDDLPGWQEGDPSRIGQEIPIGQLYVQGFVDMCVEITGMDPMPQPNWTYEDGVFHPIPTSPPDETLAIYARIERERLLRSVYDPGIMMAQRAVRLSTTPEELAYAQGKITELDQYASALLVIPDQPGFPQTIVWPVAPTK